MLAFGLYMVLFSFTSIQVEEYKIICGQEFSRNRFESSIGSLVGRGADVDSELSKCPNDWVLVRVAFVSYLKDRRCSDASALWLKFKEMKYWEDFGSGMEEVAVCFYDVGDYGAAVNSFSKVDSVLKGDADIHTRYVYAESLYGDGKESAAVDVLRSIEGVNYYSISDGVERSAYIQSLVSLSRILYAKGDFPGAAKFSTKAIAISPSSIDAYEVLLASIARDSDLDGVDSKRVYCDAMKLRIAEVGSSSSEIKGDLRIIESRILSRESRTPICRD